jgi:hypothetical protein
LPRVVNTATVNSFAISLSDRAIIPPGLKALLHQGHPTGSRRRIRVADIFFNFSSRARSFGGRAWRVGLAREALEDAQFIGRSSTHMGQMPSLSRSLPHPKNRLPRRNKIRCSLELERSAAIPRCPATFVQAQRKVSRITTEDAEVKS